MLNSGDWLAFCFHLRMSNNIREKNIKIIFELAQMQSLFDFSNHGHGTLFFEENDILGRSKYEGQWQTNPEFQESTFNGGIMNGFGKFYWSDGTQYVGQFRKDSPNGFGKTLSTEGAVLQEGQWLNGKFIQ